MKRRRDLKDLIFELTALEGSDFKDFRVNRWGQGNTLVTWYGQSDKRKEKSIYVYVKVIGLKDKKVKSRNWGKFNTKNI